MATASTAWSDVVRYNEAFIEEWLGSLTDLSILFSPSNG